MSGDGLVLALRWRPWVWAVLIWLAALTCDAVVLAVAASAPPGMSWSTGLVTFAGLAVVTAVGVFGLPLIVRRSA